MYYFGSYKNVTVYQGLSTIKFLLIPLIKINYNDNNPDKSREITTNYFKKAYGGGFLGYNHIWNFGNIDQFTEYNNNLEYEACISKLESKFKDYVNIIPETVTYSILPVLRWQYSTGEYRSLTVSDSIKINKNISIDLLAESVIFYIKKMFNKYSLLEGDLELYIMGRPWLSVDEFYLYRYSERENLTHLFNEVMEKKLSSISSSRVNLNISNKILGCKEYLYKDIIMDN